ncbi:MAG: hypothetical protein H6Q89_2269 [Myxococcaceae bacterium]|nr:hypothetical protein [Myxococcaceae bacterium]
MAPMQVFRAPFLLVVAAALTAACGAPPAKPDPRANWYRDVQPIIATRCATCHVPGGITPFALQTYEEVKEHSAQVANAVSTHRMPPWVASADCNSYKGERRLTQSEIALLVDFDKQGALLGDVADQHPLKPTGAELPWVDKTVKAAAPYTPNQFAADKKRVDDYRCFILDPDLTSTRDLIGFEVVPGDRRAVHHVLLYTVPKAEAMALEDGSPEGLGWQCFGGPGTDAPKMVGGWVPGSGVTRFPGQTGVSLFAGDVLIMQVHYNLSQTTAIPEETQVKLQYSVNPVPYHAQMFPLVDKKFAIPPNSMGYARSIEFELPVDATIWGVIPHLHTKGATAKVEILPPTGTTGADTCLVDIPKWDFQWQQFYFFSAPRGVPMSANSRLKLSCSWNNPTSQTVTWGEGTDDEMCLAFLYVTGKI